MSKTHNDLMEIFQAGLDAVAGKTVVSEEIKQHNYPAAFHVVAIGKAADAMLQGVSEERISSALLISKHGHISQKFQSQSQSNIKFQCIESDHPIPGKSSLKAGLALLDYLKKLPQKELCVFLISGGTSALVEVLGDGWSLSELSELTDYLLANAYSIDKINTVRKRISKIKGGGLWDYLGNRPVSCLMISDVPNDDPADIGSGLLFPNKPQSESKLPNIPHKWLKEVATERYISAGLNFDWKVIASISIAKQACAFKAKELGYQIKLMPNFLDGEASLVAKSCVAQLIKEPKTLFIWGGEPTVNLPEKSGKGGRNQHLALAAAIALSGFDEGYLLVAGTDGTDGITTATGALVDNKTIKKGHELGLNAEDYLKQADSHSFFLQTGELITTGATGTNVMDLVIGGISL